MKERCNDVKLDNKTTGKSTYPEVTLQSREYKGKISMQICGNCFGISALQCFDPDTIDEYDVKNNDCDFQIDDEWFTCELKDDEGNTCEIEDEMKYLGNYVVKLEIVDCIVVSNII
jgi:hypothetical protein